jgi:hypothetical protein
VDLGTRAKQLPWLTGREVAAAPPQTTIATAIAR